MKHSRTLAALLVFACALGGAPAAACSFSWNPGFSPREIKLRPDIRRVKGSFEFIELRGERFTDEEGQEWVRDGKILGVVRSKSGARWSTIHEPPDDSNTCRYGSYFKPETHAKGDFWLMRSSVKGRYRLMHFEGEYVQAEGDAVAK